MRWFPVAKFALAFLTSSHSDVGHFMLQTLYRQIQIEIFFLAIAGKKIVSE